MMICGLVIGWVVKLTIPVGMVLMVAGVIEAPLEK
jgi:hypothetical protein